MFRSLLRKTVSLIKWTFISFFFLSLSLCTYIAFEDRAIRENAKRQDEFLKQACLAADPELSSYELCRFLALRIYPDRMGKCDGFTEDKLALLKYECDKIRD
ncbi:MAG TPA: hypothetical protein PLD55_13980 [bacterium]|nr:hypothetical protein [bacterium]HPY15170.1 hypothetical protein [bacterium]HQB10997.1 hypothetical protein [bacterium]HQM85783.1 hypothetical protein [bacterium]